MAAKNLNVSFREWGTIEPLSSATRGCMFNIDRKFSRCLGPAGGDAVLFVRQPKDGAFVGEI